MAERRVPMVLGIGAALAGMLLLFRKKRPELPEAPESGVLVALLNPPREATMWQLIIYNWEGVRVDSKFYIPIAAPAVFEDVGRDSFPLRVDMLIYHDSTMDYRMQSVGTEFPFPPEWYVEAFIPDYGSYYYNVSKERFER